MFMHVAHVDEVAMDSTTASGTILAVTMPRVAPAAVQDRRPWFGLGAVAALLIGAALRLLWLAYARPEPVSDFSYYLEAALSLVDTGVFGVGQASAWRLPGFPAVLALGAVVSRDPLALAALTVLLSTTQVALTWWVAWRFFASRRAATTAAVVAAVNPAFVAFAPVLASEHLLTVCVLAALGVAVGPPRGRAMYGPPAIGRRGLMAALTAGVVLGAGALTRGEALAYLPAATLAIVLGRWRPALGTAAALRLAAVAVVGTLLVVTPWVVRNERVVGPGSGLSTTGGFNFYLAHSPGAYGWRTPLPPPLRSDDEVGRNRQGWRHGWRYVRRHPQHWWPTVRRGTSELFAPARYAGRYATVTSDPTTRRLVPRDDLSLRPLAITTAANGSVLVLVAGAAGLALIPVWRRAAWAATLGIAVANWVVYAVIFWAQARYRFVVDALACVAVGALPVTAGHLRNLRGRRRGTRR